MIGPFINSLGIISGSLLGAALARYTPPALNARLPDVFGISALGIGAFLIAKCDSLPAATLAFLFGTVIGELLRIEDGVGWLATRARALVERLAPPPAVEISQEAYLARFVSMLVLLTFSGTGVFGAMQEGLRGDPSMLIVKAALDFFAAWIFAASLGYALALLFIPQLIFQIGLVLGAGLLAPLATEAMFADFSAVGGMILLATGLQICKILPLALSNMLPGLALALPLSAAWPQIERWLGALGG